MAKRGRPKGSDSGETRARIIDAARSEFASCGFGGASVATIAAKSGLAPSAVYHYFGGKAALYEEVFVATADALWDEIDEWATGADTLVENIESIIEFTMGMTARRRAYSDFLALMPMETSLHPEFSHLLDRRTKRQDGTFSALARLGLETGELDGFDSETATEMLRSLLMGWFFETYFRPSLEPGTGDGVTTLVRLLARR